MAEDADLAIGGSGGPPAWTNGVPGQVAGQLTIDFADNNLTTTDYLVIANLPAGTIIERVTLANSTAVTLGTDIDVGTANDADGFINGADLTTAGTYVVTAAEAEGGTIESAAVEMRLTNNNGGTITAGVMTVCWFGLYCGPSTETSN
jgi:hypothetical protein